MRELASVMHNVVAFTLVAAVDAIRSGAPLRSARLQVDPGLIGELLGPIPSSRCFLLWRRRQHW